MVDMSRIFQDSVGGRDINERCFLRFVGLVRGNSAVAIWCGGVFALMHKTGSVKFMGYRPTLLAAVLPNAFPQLSLLA